MKVKKFSGVQSLNLYSDFSITIPFFVKCSKDGKVIYVRIASIKMTSKKKKSLLELGTWVSAISSLLNYFALGRYILSKTLMFLVLGGERPRGEKTFNLPFQRGFDFIGGCKYIDMHQHSTKAVPKL